MDIPSTATTSPVQGLAGLSRDAVASSTNVAVAAAGRLTSAEYVEFLRRSGLVEARHVDEALAELTPAKAGADAWVQDPAFPERLSQWLIERDLLTAWQHQRLMEGVFRGFVIDRYKLLSIVGGGGMSTVYLAEHVLMRRRVALKVLSAALGADQAGVERFYREAEAVARLAHPGIVQVHDVATQGTCHYLVMEYVEGSSLRQVVADRGRLPVPTAVQYICEVADALAHAHERGIIHRDIKPDNLLLATTGRVKVLDLGLARFSGAAEAHLTRADALLGTVDFIAPEQAEDSHQVDARADLYSLGCTLYFLLAGHAPFPTGTTAQRILFHMLKQPEAITKLRPDVPADLAELMQRTMAKQPADRTPSAAALRDELAAWLAAHPANAGDAAPAQTRSLDQTPAAAAPSTLHASGVTTHDPSPATAPGSPTPSKAGTGSQSGSRSGTGSSVSTRPNVQSAPAPSVPSAPPAKTPVRPVLAFCSDAAEGESVSALDEPLSPGSSIIERASLGDASRGNTDDRAPPSNGSTASVRVTLRRLLDYLHGGLDAESAAAIQKKVTTLPHLKALIERIQQTPGQAWLAAPTMDDALVSAEAAAAYLDRSLTTQRHELEQICLQGDLYLAEIAHCHAILAELRSGASRKVTVSRSLRQKLHRLADGS